MSEPVSHECWQFSDYQTVLFAFCPVASVNKTFSHLKWLLLFFLFLFVFQYQQLVQHVTLIVDLSIVRNMTLRGGVPFDCFNKTYMNMRNIQVMCWLAACSWNSFPGPLILQLFIHFKTTSWIRGHDDALAYPSSQKGSYFCPIKNTQIDLSSKIICTMFNQYYLFITSIAKLLITCCLFLIFVKCLHVLLKSEESCIRFFLKKIFTF